MKTINKIGLFVFSSLISFGLMAQNNTTDTIKKNTKNNLNESVIITTQFDPVVNEAIKLTENPNIFDTTFSAPSFEYDIMNKVFPTKLEIQEIKPAKVKGEPISMLYNGNIKAGIGNYLTPYFEGFYSETRNRTFIYSAHVRHYSSHWSIKDYAKSHFANNDINIYAKNIWDNFFVDAKAYYNNSINYYYGFNNDSLNLDNSSYRTIWHNVGFKANYESLYRNDNALHNKASISVEDIFGSWSSNEMTINFYAEAYKRFELFNNDKQTLGLTFNYKHSFDKFDTSIFIKAPYFSNFSDSTAKTSYNTGIISIKPYFDFKINKFELHTALDFSPEFGKESKFHIFPTAIIYFPIIPKKLYFDGGITGNIERISFNSLRIENPYISPYLEIKSTSNLKLYAGLNSTLIENLEINIEGGLQNFTNHHFYTFDPLAYYNNMFNIVYDDVVRFYFKAHLEYNIVKILALSFNAELQSFKTDKLEFAYYQPSFKSSVSLQYIAADKLIFELIPTFKVGMKAMYKGEEKTLDPIIDVNLNAEYRYNDQVSVFLKLNNIAFQRYENYYNYPSQRFMGMIGASISF